MTRTRPDSSHDALKQDSVLSSQCLRPGQHPPFPRRVQLGGLGEKPLRLLRHPAEGSGLRVGQVRQSARTKPSISKNKSQSEVENGPAEQPNVVPPEGAGLISALLIRRIHLSAAEVVTRAFVPGL